MKKLAENIVSRTPFQSGPINIEQSLSLIEQSLSGTASQQLRVFSDVAEALKTDPKTFFLQIADSSISYVALSQEPDPVLINKLRNIRNIVKSNEIKFPKTTPEESQKTLLKLINKAKKVIPIKRPDSPQPPQK